MTRRRRLLARRRNLRLLLTGGMPDPSASGLTFRSLSGGFLAQTRDNGRIGRQDLRVVTRRAPTDAELADLLFAFRVCKHVKSNTIVYAKDGATVGIGAGPAEPRRQRAHRRMEGGSGGEGGWSRCATDAGQRGGVGCVLPVRRRAGGRDCRRRDGGHSAGRISARQGGDRGGGRGRCRDGVHRHTALPALKRSVTLPR